MTQGSDDQGPPPLPRDWLPGATAPEHSPAWDARLARILAAAGRALESTGPRSSGAALDATWPATLGSWWRPAAAAVLAAALLLSLDAREAGERSPAGWLPLTMVAAEGEAAALWEGLGIDADPVLARIALQDRAP